MIVKKISIIIVSLLMVFTIAPVHTGSVYADSSVPGINLGTDALKTGANTNSAQTVWYAGKDWRVISYDGVGNRYLAQEGVLTLLASENIEKIKQFNSDKSKGNAYAGSDLQAINDWLFESLFSIGEKKAVKEHTLDVDEYISWEPYSTGVNGEKTSGFLWPLSTAEVYQMDTESSKELLKANNYWWLRSPGMEENQAADVYEVGFVDYRGFQVDRGFYGVRPAFDLDMGSVLFTSAAESGKSSGTEGADALKAQSDQTNSGDEWKVTLRSGHEDFQVTYSHPVGDNVVVEYTGAETETDGYISAIITDKPITEAGAKITYYGRIEEASAEDDASVTIKTAGKFRANDHLYVFNEQYNGEKKTDYASALHEVNANETEVQGVIEWSGDDENNRPEAVTVHLLAGEEEIASESVGPGASGLWTFSFDKVPVYDSQGNKISYSINVDEIWNNDGTRKYTTDVEIPGDYSFLITNTLDEKPKLTITAKDQSYEYNGQTQGEGDTVYEDPAQIAEKVTVEGLQAGDELTSIVVDGQGTDVGKYDLVPSNATINEKPASDKYDVTYVNGTLTIEEPTPVTYTVTFVDGQGKTLKTEKVESGKAATAPATPKRSGYTFTGWDKDFSKVTGDLTVTAKWKKNAAKVSGTLLSKMTAKGKNSLVLTWSKVKGAEGYDIFFIKCGNQSPKKVKTIKGNKTFKWTKKSLKTKKAYKAVVKAYVMKNGKKKYVRTSPMVHAYTSGGTSKYTNSKGVTVKKTRVSIKAGKTYKIKASVTKLQKGKNLMPTGHAPELRYVSSNKKVARVSKSGKITAKAKGSCKVYVIAVNGAQKTIKVTVK